MNDGATAVPFRRTGEKYVRMRCTDGRPHHWRKGDIPWYRYCTTCEEDDYELRRYCGVVCTFGSCDWCIDASERALKEAFRAYERNVAARTEARAYVARAEQQRVEREVLEMKWRQKDEQVRQRRHLTQGRRTLAEMRRALRAGRLPVPVSEPARTSQTS